MYDRFDELGVLLKVTSVTHIQQGVLVEFNYGPIILYQTGFLWNFRDCDSSVLAAVARRWADPPSEIN
jgi:hypothetical protein